MQELLISHSSLVIALDDVRSSEWHMNQAIRQMKNDAWKMENENCSRLRVVALYSVNPIHPFTPSPLHPFILSRFRDGHISRVEAIIKTLHS
jgi:hypothetical protein